MHFKDAISIGFKIFLRQNYPLCYNDLVQKSSLNGTWPIFRRNT